MGKTTAAGVALPVSTTHAFAPVSIYNSNGAYDPIATRRADLHSGNRRLFFASLAIVTALPLFVLGFGFGLLPPLTVHSPLLTVGLLPVIAATGYGHVAATAYLYVDRGFWRLIRENWARFILLPLLAVMVFFAAFRLGPAATGASNLVFFVWLLYHYQRQNYGMIAFAAQDRKLGPLPGSLRKILDLSVAAGICTMLSRQDLLGFPALRLLGIALFAGSTALLAHTFFTTDDFPQI